MHGMSQYDGRGAACILHAEGREPAKIGVERGFGAFYGAKLLKRKEENEGSKRKLGRRKSSLSRFDFGWRSASGEEVHSYINELASSSDVSIE
jgi:hypothetical protein